MNEPHTVSMDETPEQTFEREQAEMRENTARMQDEADYYDKLEAKPGPVLVPPTALFNLRRTGKDVLPITRAQWEAIKQKYSISQSDAASFQEFCDRVESFGDYLMMPWCGMWLGIERDGYTHS